MLNWSIRLRNRLLVVPLLLTGFVVVTAILPEPSAAFGPEQNSSGGFASLNESLQRLTHEISTRFPRLGGTTEYSPLAKQLMGRWAGQYSGRDRFGRDYSGSTRYWFLANGIVVREMTKGPLGPYSPETAAGTWEIHGSTIVVVTSRAISRLGDWHNVEEFTLKDGELHRICFSPASEDRVVQKIVVRRIDD